MRVARFKSKLPRPGHIEAGSDYANSAAGDELVLECFPHPRLKWSRMHPERGLRTKYVPMDGVLAYEME